MTLLSKYPIKAIFVLYNVCILLSALPIYIVKYSVPALRPHPKWTFLQSLSNKIVWRIIYTISKVQVKTPAAFSPGSLGDRYVVVTPSEPFHYRGVLLDEQVKPANIPAIWYPKAAPASTQEPVIFHIHGGAFVFGTAYPKDMWADAEILTPEVANYLLVHDYRLSCNPGGRFPAALQDAVSAYAYLLDRGIPARNIILSGDSAGANLAIAFLRYLETEGSKVGLGMPKAALLWSPWLDIHGSRDEAAVDVMPKLKTDFLSGAFLSWGATAYSDEGRASSEWVSPLGHPFKCRTPLFVYVGEAELLVDQGIRFAREMREMEGNWVELMAEEGVSHDHIHAWPLTRFKKEAIKSAKAAKEFISGI